MDPSFLMPLTPLPMHSVFRRSTTLIVVVGEYFMFHKLPSKSCMVSMQFVLQLVILG